MHLRYLFYQLVMLIINCGERQEHCVFGILLQMVPGLETQLMEGDEDEVIHVAELVSMIFLP